MKAGVGPLREAALDQLTREYGKLRERLRERPRRYWPAAAALALLLIWGVRRHYTNASRGKAKGGGDVPVGIAAARSGDIPVFLEGLGTVTAYYTVTVHSRVDGQLMSVAFREGQYVRQGDVLAQIDPRPFQAQFDQAAGQLAKDKALLDNAKLDLERYKALIAENAIPKQQLDTQAATVAQYEGMVKNDQAAADGARLQLTYARITAPISGRVGLRLVDPGNIVHASDANGLLVITQLEPITVVFTLPEDSVPQVMRRIRAGQKLLVKAFNRDKSAELATGTLLTMDNQIDPTTGTSKLKAVFDNKENALFPNQFVNVRLLLETRTGQVLVPSAAVQRGSQGTYVYVVKPDNTAEVRIVKVGVVEGNDASLDSGVSAGEKVVVDGADGLQPGSKVLLPGAAAPAQGKDTAAKGK